MRGLYLVTDPDLIGDRDLVDVVMAAVDGGATCVQLRDKRATTRQLVEIGERLRAVLAPRGVPSDVHGFCNDMTMDAEGNLYATDSWYPRVLRLKAGGLPEVRKPPAM